MKDYSVTRVAYHEVINWLKLKHYAHSIPTITDAFGLYEKNVLVGVLTYGIPPNRNLCKGICGKEFIKIVKELNRLCLLNNKKNEASFFISQTFKLLDKPAILVSYADTGQNHIGYIYQATNWIYTGLSAKRTDPDLKTDIHNRTSFVRGQKQKQRTRKHRYVYFLGSKKFKKQMLLYLNYRLTLYPKGESKNYDTSNHFATQMRLF